MNNKEKTFEILQIIAVGFTAFFMALVLIDAILNK